MNRGRAAQLFVGCFFYCGTALLSAAYAGIRPQPDVEDFVQQDVRGDVNKTNPKGGFVFNAVYGNAVLRANGGSIRVNRITGDFDASTTAGDIDVTEAGGNVSAVTQGGNILIRKVQKHVFAQAELGEIIIQSAASVDVQNNHGGDVKLFDVAGTSRVRTAGNVLLIVNKGTLKDEICSLSSTEGDIILFLPENIDADIEIKVPFSKDPSRETHIKSDLPFIAFKQTQKEEGIITLHSSINKGGSKINLFIEKGDVYFKLLDKKESIEAFFEEVIGRRK